MIFEGNCVVLPEQCQSQIGYRMRGCVCLPMPSYGMEMWIKPEAIAAAKGDIMSIVMEVSARVVPFEQARSVDWRTDWKGVDVSKSGIWSKQ